MSHISTQTDNPQYCDIQKKVRSIRLRIIDNLNASFNPIDTALDTQLEKELTKALNKLKKLTPKRPCTKSAMYLSAYA